MNKIMTAMLSLALFAGSAAIAAPKTTDAKAASNVSASAPVKLTKAEKKAQKAAKKAEAKSVEAKK